MTTCGCGYVDEQGSLWTDATIVYFNESTSATAFSENFDISSFVNQYEDGYSTTYRQSASKDAISLIDGQSLDMSCSVPTSQRIVVGAEVATRRKDIQYGKQLPRRIMLCRTHVSRNFPIWDGTASKWSRRYCFHDGVQLQHIPKDYFRLAKPGFGRKHKTRMQVDNLLHVYVLMCLQILSVSRAELSRHTPQTLVKTPSLIFQMSTGLTGLTRKSSGTPL